VNSFFYGLDSQGQLEEGAGEKISDIPVIYIAAENFDEARKKAVLVNSMFGKINREEMVRYAEEISFTPDYITAHQSYFVGSHMPAEVNVDIPFAGEVDKAEVALPSSAGDDIFQPSSYTPSIDIGEVDKAEVEKAEAKIKNTDNKKQKPLREITCRHCGHVFHIGE
jgi:hypothetical protein